MCVGHTWRRERPKSRPTTSRQASKFQIKPADHPFIHDTKLHHTTQPNSTETRPFLPKLPSPTLTMTTKPWYHHHLTRFTLGSCAGTGSESRAKDILSSLLCQPLGAPAGIQKKKHRPSQKKKVPDRFLPLHRLHRHLVPYAPTINALLASDGGLICLPGIYAQKEESRKGIQKDGQAIDQEVQKQKAKELGDKVSNKKPKGVNGVCK